MHLIEDELIQTKTAPPE